MVTQIATGFMVHAFTFENDYQVQEEPSCYNWNPNVERNEALSCKLKPKLT